MASEIRVNKLNSQTGVGTITLSPTGVDISGITTASTLRATTGIITTLQVGTISGDGSSLTGIAATDNVRTGILDVAGVSTFRNNIFQSSGRIVRGSTSTIQDGDAIAGGVNITGTDMDASVIMSVFGNDSDFNRISGAKSRNATIGSHTVVNDGDTLLSLKGFGSDGTDFEEAAQLEFQVDGSPGDNDMPGRMVFKTTADGAASPTERLRITSEGKQYIIGANSGGFNSTTLPNGNTLNINTKTSNDGLSVIRYSGSYASYALNIGRSKSDTLGTNSIVADGDDLGHITWYGADGSDFNQAATITAQVDGTPSDGTDMPGRLIFKTSADGSGTPAERARITQSGKFLVGRTGSITIASDPGDACFEQLTNNGMPLTLHCDQNDQRGFGIYYTSGKNASDFIRCQIANSAIFLVTGNGNTQNANNSYGSISDVSLKENIVDANSQWDDIKNIRVRNYNFKESTGQPTHTQIGVVAQELETVSPKLVETSDKDGMKNVQYSVLYMKAVKALQEAMTRIETLEAKVAALEGS